MKKNIISIDLDKLNGFNKYIRDEIKGAQVPTPCTLTDAVNLSGFNKGVTIERDTGEGVEIDVVHNKEEVEEYKQKILYKQDTLEDGIYEVEIGNSIQMVYVKDGKWCTTKNGLYFDDTHEFNNPRKIADL